MARRKRRGAEPGEYGDPLSKYDPPSLEDALETSLREDTVRSLHTTPFTAVTPQTTVQEVLSLMSERAIGCVMITDNDQLLGIFSERDVLMKIADNYVHMKNLSIDQIMTRHPVSVYETDTPAKAMNLMAVGSFRHIPVLDVDEKVVGIVVPTRITAYLRKYFS